MIKKVLIFISILLVIATIFSMSGYYKKENIDTSSIVNRVYEFVPDSDKATIKNWEKAKVENYKCDFEQYVINPKTGVQTNINGIDTLRVTFEVPNSVLGDISVYIEKESEEILGIDLRK